MCYFPIHTDTVKDLKNYYIGTTRREFSGLIRVTHSSCELDLRHLLRASSLSRGRKVLFIGDDNLRCDTSRDKKLSVQQARDSEAINFGGQKVQEEDKCRPRRSAITA